MAEENSDVQIRYNGQDILVSKKVADFLERDRKKIAALQRSDRETCNKDESRCKNGYQYGNKFIGRISCY